MQNQIPPSGWPPGYTPLNNYLLADNFPTSYQGDVTPNKNPFFTSSTQYPSANYNLNYPNSIYQLPSVPSSNTTLPQNLGNPLSLNHIPTAIPVDEAPTSQRNTQAAIVASSYSSSPSFSLSSISSPISQPINIYEHQQQQVPPQEQQLRELLELENLRRQREEIEREHQEILRQQEELNRKRLEQEAEFRKQREQIQANNSSLKSKYDEYMINPRLLKPLYPTTTSSSPSSNMSKDNERFVSTEPNQRTNASQHSSTLGAPTSIRRAKASSFSSTESNSNRSPPPIAKPQASFDRLSPSSSPSPPSEPKISMDYVHSSDIAVATVMHHQPTSSNTVTTKVDPPVGDDHSSPQSTSPRNGVSSPLSCPSVQTPSTQISQQSRPLPRPPSYLIAKKPLSVFSTPTEFIIRNSRQATDDPLVIEKKDGKVGSFYRFKEKEKEKVTEHTRNSTFIDAYAILGIITLDNESFLILVTEAQIVGSILGVEIFCITGTKFLPFDWQKEAFYSQPGVKIPYAKVQKFCNSGMFYFSYDYHITHSIQRQEQLANEIRSKPHWKVADRRFFWNRFLLRHFLTKRLHDWITVVTRGYFGIEKQIYLPNGNVPPCDLALFSRISCLRAGTRFNARGINDDGNVANFVETEQIIVSDKMIFSYVQIRGSVPIFWEERVNSKPNLTRSAEATVPAFKKHFDELLKLYQRVCIINLLSNRKKEEELVSNGYSEQLVRYKNLDKNSITYKSFDFHAECGGRRYENISKLINEIKSIIDSFGFYIWNGKEGKCLLSQTGVFRTNCLDCLDRTNVTQCALARVILSNQLANLGADFQIAESSRLGIAFNQLWANNGDWLSKAYAGTGAIKSSYTRKGKSTLAGFLDDGVKSVTRLYMANFRDQNTQEAIDLFLGNIEDILDESEQSLEERWVQERLTARQQEFTTTEKKRVFVATWNVSGRPPSATLDFDQLITPQTTSDHQSIDLYVIGLQEIVELNAGSVLNTDTTNRKRWEEFLMHQINSRRTGKKVVLLRSEQLVGLFVCAFIVEDDIQYIRDLAVENSKTGLYGFSGSKGALCLRFVYKDTSICFVCAHLSAGQNNVNDRIKDYNEIMGGIRFGTNRAYAPRIIDNDYVIWLGDLNFRLNVGYVEALQKIAERQYDLLLRYDQLKLAQSQGQIFKEFQEGKIDFPPTYKYDTGSDRYDTSEKRRVPGWTDRILFYFAKDGINRIEQELYKRGELKYSDHRPVKALFNFTIKTILKDKKAKIERELFKIARTLDADTLSKVDVTIPTKLVDLSTVEEERQRLSRLNIGNDGDQSGLNSLLLSPPPLPPRPSQQTTTNLIDLSAANESQPSSPLALPPRPTAVTTVSSPPLPPLPATASSPPPLPPLPTTPTTTSPSLSPRPTAVTTVSSPPLPPLPTTPTTTSPSLPPRPTAVTTVSSPPLPPLPTTPTTTSSPPSLPPLPTTPTTTSSPSLPPRPTAVTTVSSPPLPPLPTKISSSPPSLPSLPTITRTTVATALENPISNSAASPPSSNRVTNGEKQSTEFSTPSSTRNPFLVATAGKNSPLRCQLEQYKATLTTLINELSSAFSNVHTIMSSVNLIGAALQSLRSTTKEFIVNFYSSLLTYCSSICI